MTNGFGNLEDDSFSRQMYFPTLIYRIECSDSANLNPYLLNLIRSERQQDSDGIVRSNYRGLGGWHSHNHLYKDPAYAPLTDRIAQAGRRISDNLGYDQNYGLTIGTMWSITNPPGSANKVHIHPGSHWSGVYYIQAPEGCGNIEFTDPRTAHVMNLPSFPKGQKRSRENWTKVNFTPRAGVMLIFPSWLYHGVDPNLTTATGADAERVIISFNMAQNKMAPSHTTKSLQQSEVSA
ncbi:TIGR02466 family protein [uncultured Tateyamaria sp.]|uniref:TIGR02466 family protein n=1 Tax=uncultured Tateyamaria sp. TaxID=455651 RepID=UPI002604EECF|nr:TIGR02466 family protein [uncultured Tateyamaria sp.]